MEQKPNIGSNPNQTNPVHNVPPDLRPFFLNNPNIPAAGVKILDT
jgi:hypothetical protein